MARIDTYRKALQSRLTKIENSKGAIDKGLTVNQLNRISNLAKKSGNNRIASSADRSAQAIKKWDAGKPPVVKEASFKSTLSKALRGSSNKKLDQFGRNLAASARKDSRSMRDKIKEYDKVINEKGRSKVDIQSYKARKAKLKQKQEKINTDVQIGDAITKAKNRGKFTSPTKPSEPVAPKSPKSPKSPSEPKVENKLISPDKSFNASKFDGAEDLKNEKKMGLGKILAIGAVGTAAVGAGGLYALDRQAQKKQEAFRKTAEVKLKGRLKPFFLTKLANTSVNSFINSFDWDSTDFTLDKEKFKNPAKKEQVHIAIRRQLKRYDNQDRLTPAGKERLESGNFDKIERRVDYL